MEDYYSKRQKDDPLYDLLYSWILDINGRNISRLSGFRLYQAISRNVRSAIPKDQIDKPIFSKYRLESFTPGSLYYYRVF